MITLGELANEGLFRLVGHQFIHDTYDIQYRVEGVRESPRSRSEDGFDATVVHTDERTPRHISNGKYFNALIRDHSRDVIVV